MGYFCILYDVRETFFAFLCIVLFPFISWLCILCARNKIKVQCMIPSKTVFVGQKKSMKICIVNRSILPISNLKLTIIYQNTLVQKEAKEELVLSVMGKSSQEIELSFRTEYIGAINVRVNSIALCDYTKCFVVKKKLSYENQMIVLPEPCVIKGNFSAKTQEMLENEAQLLPKPGTDQTELLAVREYQPGDRFARIHWKLSDKYDDYMVKEYMMPLYYYPLFLLDLRRLEDSKSHEILDTMLSAFYSIALWHVQNESLFEAGFYDKKYETMELHVISSKEELETFMLESYNACYVDGTSQCLQRFYTMKPTKMYSNILYFTGDNKSDQSLIEEMAAYLVLFKVGGQSSDKKEDMDNTQGDRMSVINREKMNQDLLEMIRDYRQENKGDQRNA